MLILRTMILRCTFLVLFSSDAPAHQEAKDRLTGRLIDHLYDSDLEWVEDGKLVGMTAPEFKPRDNRGLSGQRGLRFM